VEEAEVRRDEQQVVKHRCITTQLTAGPATSWCRCRRSCAT
jgi:hypothetical protein